MKKDVDELLLYPREWVNETSSDIHSVVHRWAQKEIIENRLEYTHKYDTLFDEKRKILNLTIGLQQLALPEEYGGGGWNTMAHGPGLVSVVSEIARADAAVAVISSMTYSILGIIAFDIHRNDALCKTIAPIFTAGELITPSIILPGAGIVNEDTPLFFGRSLSVRIKSLGEKYELSGVNVRAIACGQMADLYCVACGDESGHPCVAFVPADSAGIRKGPIVKTTGLNACRNADISFEGTIVPAAYVLKDPGVLETLYTWLNIYLGAASVGASINFFEILTDWAESRVIKGRTPMKENPLCASVLADVAEEIALSRILLYNMSRIILKEDHWGCPEDLGLFTYAQMIGARIQKSVILAVNRGMELMGSAGYAKEWHVEKHWRDIKTIQSALCGVGASVPVKMDIARFFYDCKEV
jgi:alkylation response protein AidB-like acyl-CoA dehydrogenase